MSVKSTFKCTGCGNDGMPIQRRESSQRKHGHLKDLYCVQCKTVTRHVEDRAVLPNMSAARIGQCNACCIKNAQDDNPKPLCGEECSLFKVMRETILDGKVFPEEDK